MEQPVPEAHQQAAEEVRAHLVAVRGGAPFLSPADARLLVAWLDEGVPVATILQAIERAAEARRKQRSRLPLTLGRAKVHLGQKGAVAPIAADRRHAGTGAAARSAGSGRHPLAPVADALEGRADDLARDLLALPAGDPDRLVRAALGRVRAFLAARWEALGDDERERRLAACADRLRELDLGLSEKELHASAEEMARDDLRAAYPELSAATLVALVSP